jgi:hypothetical protein
MNHSFDTMQAISQQRRQPFKAEAARFRSLRCGEDALESALRRDIAPRRRSFPWRLGRLWRPAALGAR